MITSANLLAVPKNVIIIRHGEKLFPGAFCLSLQGLERASALAHYFSESQIYNIPPITHVFAAYRWAPHPYIRNQQTCQPIADHLNVPLDISFTEKQIDEVTQEVLTNPKYNNTTVLMCWEHTRIRLLVMAFGGEDPGYWPSNIYDEVYMLTFNKEGKPTFQKFLQTLLFGDRATFDAQPTPLPQVRVPCPTCATSPIYCPLPDLYRYNPLNLDGHNHPDLERYKNKLYNYKY
jgi:hypothetical protein